MGAQLVGLAFAVASRLELKPHEALLLIGMAHTALDSDKAPRYFGSRESSAFLLGRFVPDEADPDAPNAEEVRLEREAAFKSVQRAVRGLTRAGAIQVRRTPRIGQRAEYSLPVDLWRKVALTDPSKTKSVHLDRTKTVHLPRTQSVRPEDENRPPKETQEPQEDLGEEEHPDPAEPHVSSPQGGLLVGSMVEA
jgi:hypothetical protein